MKLLFCKTCSAVFSLKGDKTNCPNCGSCGGYYTDGLNAVYWGEAVPLGFANDSFVSAIAHQPDESPGRQFTAFVIEKNCETFKHEGEKNANHTV